MKTLLAVILSSLSFAQSPCDLNGDGKVTSTDVNVAVSTALNTTACGVDITCTTKSVQTIVAAVLTQPCSSQHTVALSWTASTSVNAIGYNLYRGVTTGGPYPTKVNVISVSGTNYTDTTVKSGVTYYYVARAVDNMNNESANSNETKAAIPAP